MKDSEKVYVSGKVKAEQRAKLANDVEAFLAAGGEVQQIPAGVSNDPFMKRRKGTPTSKTIKRLTNSRDDTRRTAQVVDIQLARMKRRQS